MNYLELINKCLVELNYKQVNAFEELVKNDHKKIKNIINLVNNEICKYDKWNFLLRKIKLTLPKHCGELENLIPGRISLLLIDGVKYDFFEDFKKFLTNSQPMNTYSEMNDKILLPIFNEDKIVEIVYYSGNCAKDENGTEKTYLEKEKDCSLIPQEFVEPLIVYGTCMRLKASPQHVKFSYWLSMYKDALSGLRAKNCISADYAPTIKLIRD